MTKNEFENIREEHMKLELKVLRLQAQQRDLLENLIGQSVRWTDGWEGFFTGTIVSCDGPKHLLVESSVVKHHVRLHMLRISEKEVQDGD